MLKWAAIFFVIAIIAAVFGFSGIAAGRGRDREGSVFHISSRFRDYFDHGNDAKVVQTAIDACSVHSLGRHDEYCAVAGKAKGAADATHEYVRENPWKALGVAAAAGLIIEILRRNLS